jgi:OmpR family response regulator RpaB
MEAFTLKICGKTILIVDSDINLSQLLSTRFTVLGYRVLLAFNGKDALFSFRKEQPDLVILDLLLPKLDGCEVCSRIRENSQIPIIILTALSNISDRITGLEFGADDYILKPFSLKELEARVRAVLRRSNPQVHKIANKKYNRFQIGNLIVDMHVGLVLKNNFKVNLTPTEYKILELLIENAGNKLSRTLILDNIWGYTPERYADIRIVDVHISRLRSKIEEDPSRPELILTERGIGYLFIKP